MRTTLNIDENVLKAVMAVTGEKYRVRAIRRALEEYVRRRRVEELRAAGGTIELANDLDELEELEKREMGDTK